MAMSRKRTVRPEERRRSERAEAKLSMRLESAELSGSTKMVTESQNISASGLYCHASHYLAPFSKVQMAIVLPVVGAPRSSQDVVKVEAIVVRCTQRAGDRSATPYDLACMFTDLDTAVRRRIEEFVQWRNLQALVAAATGGRVVRTAPAGKDPARPVARKAARPSAKAGAAKKSVRKKAAAKARPTARKATRKSARGRG
jgi:hypothetical protein